METIYSRGIRCTCTEKELPAHLHRGSCPAYDERCQWVAPDTGKRCTLVAGKYHRGVAHETESR